MNSRKIYICTTFREFNGDANANIQELFLKSLINQTYNDWELVVTTFGEKNVESTLRELKVPYKIIEAGKQSYRFSLTDVVLNGIQCLEATGGTLLWTTADIIFPQGFLEEVNRICRPGIVGTSHPHLMYESISKFQQNKHLEPSIYEGFDLIFFDDSVLLKKGGKQLIESYRYVDWGVFECFLVGVANKCAEKKINLWQSQKVGKIVNDRVASKETRDYFESSHNNNLVVFNKFLKDTGQSRLLATLVYCNLCFRPKSLIAYWQEFHAELKDYFRDQKKKIGSFELLRQAIGIFI